MKMYCPNCNAQLPEGASFCPKCGTSIQTEKRCPQCNSLIASDSSFCPKCGASLDSQPPAKQKSRIRQAHEAGVAEVKKKGWRGLLITALVFLLFSCIREVVLPALRGEGPDANRPKTTFDNIDKAVESSKFTLVGPDKTPSVGSSGPTLEYHTPSSGSSGSSGGYTSPSGGSSSPSSDYTSPSSGSSGDYSTPVVNYGSENADYGISILSARMSEDWDGNPMIVVKYSFTNISDDTLTFMSVFYDKVTQNGVTLSPSVINTSTDLLWLGGDSDEIRPGETLLLERAHTLRDTTTNVEIELSSWGTIVAQKAFKLTD